MIFQPTMHRRLLGLAVAIGLASCAVSDTTQYYTLSRTASGSSTTGRAEPVGSTSPQSTVAGSGSPTIGVGPVIVPTYLDRTQIVTRTGTDQVELSMFHRWAEPLEDGIARTLAEELAVRIPTERIVMFPWRGSVARLIQYQVAVSVLRFDGRLGGNVMLDTRWRILGGDGKELVLKRTTVSGTAAGPGYQAMVAAMAQTLATLGQEMSTEIRAIPR